MNNGSFETQRYLAAGESLGADVHLVVQLAEVLVLLNEFDLYLSVSESADLFLFETLALDPRVFFLELDIHRTQLMGLGCDITIEEGSGRNLDSFVLGAECPVLVFFLY